MAYDIYKDPNIVAELGQGKFKRKDGKIVDKYGIVIKQGETLASTPKPKLNLFDFQTKIPGTTTNKIVPSATAIATSVKPKNNIYTPSSPASMVKKPVITPSTGIPGISQASASEKDLIQTYFDDKTQDVENKKTFVQMLQDGVPSTEIEDILVNKIKYNPQTTPVKEEGFLSRLGESASKRFEQAGKQQATGIEGGLQFGGALGGFVGDLAGNILTSAYETAGEPGKEMMRGLLKTEVGQKAVQALGEGMESYNAFKTENPRTANALENIVNITNLVGATALGKSAVKGVKQIPQGVKTIGTKLEPLIGEKTIRLKPGIGEVPSIDKTTDVLRQKVAQTFRPSVQGVDTTAKLEINEDKLIEGVKRVATEHGIPNNARDALRKATDTKQKIWQQVESMNKQVDIETPDNLIKSKLEDFRNSKEVVNLNKAGININKTLDDLIEQYSGDGKITQADLQAIKTNINKEIGNKWSQMLTTDKGGLIAKGKLSEIISDILDDNLEKTIGTTNKSLMKEYGSVRTLEKELVKRVGVAERQNPAKLIDMFGADSIPYIISGILTGDVKSTIFGRAKQAVIKTLKSKNDVNTQIKDLFKIAGGKDLTTLQQKKITEVGNLLKSGIIKPTNSTTIIKSNPKVDSKTILKPSILSDKEKALIKNPLTNGKIKPSNTSTKPTSSKTIPEVIKKDIEKKSILKSDNKSYDLKSKGAFIRIPGKSNDLINEAKKYKSADEFVKNNVFNKEIINNLYNKFKIGDNKRDLVGTVRQILKDDNIKNKLSDTTKDTFIFVDNAYLDRLSDKSGLNVMAGYLPGKIKGQPGTIYIRPNTSVKEILEEIMHSERFSKGRLFNMEGYNKNYSNIDFEISAKKGADYYYEKLKQIYEQAHKK